MNKKNNSKYFLIFQCICFTAFIFCISLIFSIIIYNCLSGDKFHLSYNDNAVVLIEAMVETCAVGFVLYELRMNSNAEKRENDIEEARFLLEFNQAFIKDPEMCKVEHRLERWMEEFIQKQETHCSSEALTNTGTQINQEPLITLENRQMFINYLVYLEGLAPIIFRNILRLEHIDDLMAYRFFLAMNNPKMQEDQLKKYPEYYRGCFKLYAKWKSYRTAHDYDIVLPEPAFALDLWKNFESVCESPIIARRLTQNDNLCEVTKLIYNTDFYLYPASFENRIHVFNVLPKLMKMECMFKSNNIFVAEINNTIVGIAVIISDTSFCDQKFCRLGVQKRYFDHIRATVCSIAHSAYLMCLYVHKKYRGQCIGEVLLKYVISECREKNIKVISLDLPAQPQKNLGHLIFTFIAFVISKAVIIISKNHCLNRIASWVLNIEKEISKIISRHYVPAAIVSMILKATKKISEIINPLEIFNSSAVARFYKNYGFQEQEKKQEECTGSGCADQKNDSPFYRMTLDFEQEELEKQRLMNLYENQSYTKL